MRSGMELGLVYAESMLPFGGISCLPYGRGALLSHFPQCLAKHFEVFKDRQVRFAARPAADGELGFFTGTGFMIACSHPHGDARINERLHKAPPVVELNTIALRYRGRRPFSRNRLSCPPETGPALWVRSRSSPGCDRQPREPEEKLLSFRPSRGPFALGLCHRRKGQTGRASAPIAYGAVATNNQKNETNFIRRTMKTSTFIAGTPYAECGEGIPRVPYGLVFR